MAIAIIFQFRASKLSSTIMKKIALYITSILFAIILSCPAGVRAQVTGTIKQTPQAAAKTTTPDELAKLAVKAHGGEKLTSLKTLVISGSADINSFNQPIAATFALVIAGDKYRLDINNPFQPLKQIYNGSSTYSSINGFSLPPMTSLGLPLLMHYGQKDYTVAELPEKLKKRRGFRMTSPEGFYTDFLLDEKTNEIKGYESSYMVGDRAVTTSVEVNESLLVDGVLMPKKYSQRFDLGQITAYASFKAKEILVNSTVEDSVFKLQG